MVTTQELELKWHNPTNLNEIELALDHGNLFIAMSNGRFWLCRRNGSTKLWKRDLTRFRLPIKFGLKGTGQIDEATELKHFRVAQCREDAEGHIGG
jgi:hypothetical protein